MHAVKFELFKAILEIDLEFSCENLNNWRLFEIGSKLILVLGYCFEKKNRTKKKYLNDRDKNIK